MVHVSQLSVLDMSSTLMEETLRENSPRLQTGYGMNITNLLLSSTAIFTRKISLLQLRSKTAYRLQL
jgi:hypothetical protein